jgi:hypothetical protein
VQKRSQEQLRAANGNLAFNGKRGRIGIQAVIRGLLTGLLARKTRHSALFEPSCGHIIVFLRGAKALERPKTAGGFSRADNGKVAGRCR